MFTTVNEMSNLFTLMLLESGSLCHGANKLALNWLLASIFTFDNRRLACGEPELVIKPNRLTLVAGRDLCSTDETQAADKRRYCKQRFSLPPKSHNYNLRSKGGFFFLFFTISYFKKNPQVVVLFQFCGAMRPSVLLPLTTQFKLSNLNLKMQVLFAVAANFLPRV